MRISVAIDGPAGAGKSTIAKILGKKLNLIYINTGAMYRAVTLKALEKDISSENIEELCTLISAQKMTFDNDRLLVNGTDVTESLSLPLISQNVSKYAAIQEVRTRLVQMQRDMSKEYDVIMDGRDIGTVVLRDAAFKFFVTATPGERAQRRFNELKAKNIDVIYDELLKEIIQRDFLDSNREIDPLTKAEDALLVDTTGMNIEEVVDFIYNNIVNTLKQYNI